MKPDEATETRTLGVFNLNQGLRIMPAPNGGYVLMGNGGRGIAEDIIGAFSDAPSMIEALKVSLI